MNTSMKKVGLVGLTLIGAALATILLVSLTAATASPTSPADLVFGTTITGTVSLPAPPGSLVLPVPAFTYVWLMTPDEWPPIKPDPVVHGKSLVDKDTGAFHFANVPPGVYLIRAVPAVEKDYTPSFIRHLVVMKDPVNAGTLYLTNPVITGTVYRPTPLGPREGIVHVYDGRTQVEVRRTRDDGTFRIGGLYTGTYSLIAEPRDFEWLWWSRPVTDAVVLDETHLVTLTLQWPDVYGITEDSEHTPVPDAVVRATALTKLLPAAIHSDVSGPLGEFAIGDMPTGEALIVAEPPSYRGGLLPVTCTVTLPHFTPITLTFLSSPKVVTGFVTTNVMSPVQNALIVANRVGALGSDSVSSDVNGYYSLKLAPGLWALTVKATRTTDPGKWVYPLPPQLIHFDDDLRREVKQLDFKVLTADATVVGIVEMPDHSPPPFTVTVGLHTDEGIGVKQDVDAAGRFTFTVPHHVYKVDVRVLDPGYAAPPLDSIYAAPLTTTVVPTITLIARDAVITGTLTLTGTNAPAKDVPVIAWNPDTHAAFSGRSGPDGLYMVTVYSGTWWVRPAPLPDQPYQYTGKPSYVTVVANQAAPNVDFSMLSADATIHGVLVDPRGNVANDARGWGKAVDTADPANRNGAPVMNGMFDILVPGGATYSVSLRLADGSSYVYTGTEQTASVGAGETVTLTFPLDVKNARFVGALIDRRNNDDIVEKQPARVWAWGEGLWLNTDVDTGNGTYVLPVPDGLWGLDYSLPEDSEYVKLVGPRYYGLGPGQTQVANLPVTRKDGTLTGVILLPNGRPAIGAVAVAEGFTPDLQNLTLREQVDVNGMFTMTLPSGWYVVRATRASNEVLINPVEKHVLVPRNSTANVILQYRRPDTRITGEVTLSGTTAYTGPVSLWAWSNAGGYNKTIAPLGGVYTMPVISNTLWNLVATYETRDQYWKARVRVPVTTTNVTRDLVLNGPFDKPAPVSVLFDPTVDQDIELPGYTRIHIPGGAIPVASGNVLLNITPLAGAPHHQNGDVLGLTYAFEAFTEDGQPITDNFNQDVVIVLKYNPLALLAMGLDVNHLRPAYFSTTTDSWTMPDSYLIDEGHREITMQIDHFTRFGALGAAGANFVFLPAVLR